MFKESLCLNTVDTVKKFVDLANQFDFPIKLSSGNYCIDGKSIMGIFGVDLSKPLQVEIEDENAPQLNSFKEKIREFVAA